MNTIKTMKAISRVTAHLMTAILIIYSACFFYLHFAEIQMVVEGVNNFSSIVNKYFMSLIVVGLISTPICAACSLFWHKRRGE
jgi:predicted tellurium resistance membrane protein TerC